MANDNEWKRAEWGKAKAAFDKSRTVQPKPVEKPLPPPGRQSEMVKKTNLGMNGPKPPGGIGERVAQQTNNRALAKEAADAMKAQPQVSGVSKPRVVELSHLIELEHLKEGQKLRQKFQDAARRDKDKER